MANGIRLVSASAIVAISIAAIAGTASANPRTLPFTYPHEQLPEGGTELEQFVDFTTAKANVRDEAGTLKPRTYGMFQFQTEFEHGLTDRLELGLYVTYAPSAPSDFTDTPVPIEGNGMKQRLRYKLADIGVWPIDVSLYGEISENEREVDSKRRSFCSGASASRGSRAKPSASSGFAA